MTKAAKLGTYPPHLQNMTWYENYLKRMHQFEVEEHDDEEVDDGLAANLHDSVWPEPAVEGKPEHEFLIDQFSAERSEDKADQQLSMLNNLIPDRIHELSTLGVFMWENMMLLAKLWDADGCEAAAILHDSPSAVDAKLETHSLIDLSPVETAEDDADHLLRVPGACLRERTHRESIMSHAKLEAILQDPKSPIAAVKPKQGDYSDIDRFLVKMADENTDRQLSDASTAVSEDESIEA
jgi:hypothetical protein